MKKEADVLKYIKLYLTEFKRMPTSKEMCDHLLIGRGSLNRILLRLMDKKILIKIPITIPYRLNE